MDLGVCEVAGSTETETEQLAKKVITAAGISQLKVTFRGTTSSLPTKLSQNVTQDKISLSVHTLEELKGFKTFNCNTGVDFKL